MTRAQIEKAVASDIAVYCAGMRKHALTFDDSLREATEKFLDCLEQTGHRQALLVVAGYQLCGGTDINMILTAARAVQMTHVYAEMCREQTQHLIGGLNGQHAAQMLLANVAAEDELRLKAVSITNRALLLYMHAVASEDQQTDAALDCFATELTLNPLHVGMVFAGADCAATDEITAFAMNAGRALLTKDEHSREYREHASNELAACTSWSQQELKTIAQLVL